MKNMLEYKLSILFYGVDTPVNNHDYIINDIFKNYKFIECDYLLVGEEKESNKIYDVLVYNCADPNRSSHFGFPPTYEQTKNAVLKFKPKIILQLADECWQEHNEIHNLLANLCNLFLKQHRHESQLSSYSDNLHPIPLGYVNEFMSCKKPIKPIKERKYTWSWVGFLKGDRSQMINWFWAMWKNITVCNAYMPPSEVYDLYSESIFVPCGRGNFSLDCFRNYEAVVAGAIPVVSGSLTEMEWTYKFFDEKPPWIYAETWRDALLECQKIQFDNEKLQQMQDENIAWWNRMMNKIQDKVSQALMEDRLNYLQALSKVKDKENNFEQPQSTVFYRKEQKLPEGNYIDGYQLFE